MSSTRLLRLSCSLAAMALLTAACGSDSSDSTDTESGGGDGGAVVISGSSTVEPISIVVAEGFREEQPDVNVSVTGPGTGSRIVTRTPPSARLRAVITPPCSVTMR